LISPHGRRRGRGEGSRPARKKIEGGTAQTRTDKERQGFDRLEEKNLPGGPRSLSVLDKRRKGEGKRSARNKEIFG